MNANVYEPRRLLCDNAGFLPFNIALGPDKVFEKTNIIFDRVFKTPLYFIVDMKVGIAKASTRVMKMLFL